MHRAFTALIVAPLVLSSACHMTQLVATWHDPQAGRAQFQHSVAVFASKDEALRRTVEDHLAASFPNTTPSYRVLNNVSMEDNEAVAQQLRTAGYDGAIMMRVVDVTTQVTYSPGTYWYGTPYGFRGYWRDAWAVPYDPGQVYTDQIVTVETNVYNLATDKLIFAARSNSTNPSSAGKLADSVIRHVRHAMEKNGMIARLFSEKAPITGL